ncbi:MAG: transglycosylase SLT domain-containing protein, partial [bacterium]
KKYMKRREFGKGLLGVAAISAMPANTNHRQYTSEKNSNSSPINVFLPLEYKPPEGTDASDFPFRFIRATLEFLESGFLGQNIPIWFKKFEEVDFEKRVSNIASWIMQGVQKFKKIHPVDPVWVMAQIMHESYFYEFSVSTSLAVGICQFVSRTAHEFEMLCAGDRQEHAKAPNKLPEFALKENDYHQLRQQKRDFMRANRLREDLTYKMLMEWIAAGKADELKPDAEKYFQQQAKLKIFDEQIQKARDDYIAFVRANLEGRDIFNEDDLNFLLKFDERVTYKKPIFGMIQMLARALRARNGYIIAAAAGYNAGLSTTRAEGVFKPYGQIPNFEETVTYLSRVFILHHEISKRLG